MAIVLSSGSAWPSSLARSTSAMIWRNDSLRWSRRCTCTSGLLRALPNTWVNISRAGLGSSRSAPTQQQQVGHRHALESHVLDPLVGEDLGQGVVEGRQHQRGLVVPPGVDRADGHSGVAGDVGDAGLVVAAPLELRGGGLQQPAGGLDRIPHMGYVAGCVAVAHPTSNYRTNAAVVRTIFGAGRAVQAPKPKPADPPIAHRSKGGRCPPAPRTSATLRIPAIPRVQGQVDRQRDRDSRSAWALP